MPPKADLTSALDLSRHFSASRAANVREPRGSPSTQGQTDAGHDAIPRPFFPGRITNQHAVNETFREIAAIVPNLVALVARYGEEARRYPLVLNVLRRVLPSQEFGGRNTRADSCGLYDEFSPTVGTLKSLPIAFWRATHSVGENRGRNFDRGRRPRNTVSFPCHGLRGGRHHQADKSPNSGFEVRSHRRATLTARKSIALFSSIEE